MQPSRKIDPEALRVALIAGHSNARIAEDNDVSVRTVRRAVADQRSAHGPRWPRVPQAVQAAPKPGQAPAEIVIPPPPEDASPDELEAYALRVWVAESQAGRGADRIAAAGKIVELARERRSRRDPADAAPDPAEVAALAMLEIERATENVEAIAATPPSPVEKSNGARSIQGCACPRTLLE